METNLHVARRHVADGSRLGEEQAARIARLAPDQVDAGKSLLETMQRTLGIFTADLARWQAKSLLPARKI